MRISDWSSDVCSSDLNAAKLFCLVILVLAAPGRPVLAEGLPFALAEALDGGLAAAGTDEEAAGFADLGRFYLSRVHLPLWVLDDAAGPRAQTLFKGLAAADLAGVDPDDSTSSPHAGLLAPASPDALADLEVG